MKINKQDLENLVDRINDIAGTPKEHCSRIDGKFKANIGNYYLSGAYGGWKLEQVVNEGGGCTSITNGFVPKKDLYYEMQAFISGLCARERNQ